MSLATGTITSGIGELNKSVSNLAARLPESIVLLAARISIAMVFWQSGRTKVDGFRVIDSAIMLFEFEYALPLIPPVWAAHLAAAAEHILPIMLVIGLGTRLGALGLLVMTLVIQTFVYPGAWVTHLMWSTVLLVILTRGPGVFSLDHLIVKSQ